MKNNLGVTITGTLYHMCENGHIIAIRKHGCKARGFRMKYNEESL